MSSLKLTCPELRVRLVEQINDMKLTQIKLNDVHHVGESGQQTQVSPYLVRAVQGFGVITSSTHSSEL